MKIPRRLLVISDLLCNYDYDPGNLALGQWILLSLEEEWNLIN